MMKKMKKYVMLLLAAMLLLPMSSCIEVDDWFDDDLWECATHENDMYLEDALIGHWRLSYVAEGYGVCPYYSGDHFYFHPDGVFEMEGSKGFYEQGYWFVENGEIKVAYNRFGRVDLLGRIRRMNRHFLAVHIRDYDGNAGYTLELER